MDRPRIYVDFNEMVEPDLVLLSKTDEREDSSGHTVRLYAGLRVNLYMDDVNDEGAVDNLVADGVVEPNLHGGWAGAAKWCCRIDARGIRNLSDCVE